MSGLRYSVLRDARLHSLAAALSLALGSLALGATDRPPFVHSSRVDRDTSFKLKTARIGKFYVAALAELRELPVAHSAERAATTFHVDRLGDSGEGTLRDALSHAVDGDVIDVTTLRGTLTLTAPLIPAAKVSINGPGRGLLTLDSQHLDRVIESNHSLKVSNITIANGATPKNSAPVGGCLFVQGAVTLSNVTLDNCSADGSAAGYAYGGAIATLGSVSIESSTLTNNSAVAQYHTGDDLAKPFMAAGGAIFATASADYRGVAISNSTFTANSVSGSRYAEGGAIASDYYGAMNNETSDVLLNNTTVSGNSVNATGIAPYYSTTYHQTFYVGAASGAGLSVAAGNVDVTVSQIVNNNAVGSRSSRGAGVYVAYGVSYNDTTYMTYLVGGSIKVAGSTISGNAASSTYLGTYGAGLAVSDDISIETTVFSENHARSQCTNYCFSAGGAIAGGRYTTKLAIIASTLSGNTVTAGAAGFASGGALTTRRHEVVGTVVKVTNSTVSGNAATSAAGYAFGAGICQQVSSSVGKLQVYNSTVAFNTTNGFGGGIVFNGYGLATLYSAIVANNSSTAYLGASDIAALTPTFTIGGDNNLVQTDPSIYGVALSGLHNIVGSDPLLEPLAYNGGPTATHSLDPASPAIDAGQNPLALSFDQRGRPYSRVVGADADIGAFELDTDHIFGSGFD